MGLTFLGDIALPSGVIPRVAESFPSYSSPAIANLEGPIIDPEIIGGSHGLWNSNDQIVPFLVRSKVQAVSLANNHVFDCKADISDSISILQNAGLSHFGAGVDAAAAQSELYLYDKSYALLSFGWEVIGCEAASPKHPGVCPLRPEIVLRRVTETRAATPKAHVVVMMHWNYEGELYPQPMHRQLAFAAIDAGASLVIGCHPHCVQGIEFYKSCPIVYSLGNWFLPSGVFWKGKLSYPDFTYRQLAFEWDPETGVADCHWYQYSPADNSLTLVCTEPARGSREVGILTPFENLSHEEYIRWFIQNRRKRWLLPVYRDYRAKFVNKAKDLFVGSRQVAIAALSAMGLKRGPK